ncbi:ABC transporter ATP-binding protein [Streptosporangiaceae bacterium NEAU-GS5]|nr:ABC transporter ATP-binding protein [Streptosporangiaceae bacterium NEAU-GS5]
MLSLADVSKVYRVGAFGGKTMTAVDGVTFDVDQGQVVSLIGESGSGKSTIGRMILGLTAITKGSITFDGAPVRPGADYYRKVQGVFQDPFSCYNPVFKIDHMFQLIRQIRPYTQEKLEESISSVRLEPGQVLGKYPHQLSGGQLQRLLIARALLLDIRLLVADEITSMLDASTRIDVLNLLVDLKARGLGVLYITHDLSLGNYLAERTVVLRRGVVVEMGPTEKVFEDPLHPYTRQLLAAVPRLHAPWEDARPAGCGVHSDVQPDPDHYVACSCEKEPE